MTLLKRLGGAPQPNDTVPIASPASEGGIARSGGIATAEPLRPAPAPMTSRQRPR